MDDKDKTPLFVVDADPRVLWPVTLRLPVDGGQFADHRFHAVFRVLPESRYVELLDKVVELDDASTEAMLAENARRFPAFVADWTDELKDGAGNVIAFSEAKLQELVTGPYGGPLSRGLWHAITEVRYKARLGNSVPPPAVGADPAASGS
ncbi:MAG: hypothetical protein Q7U97_06755 [Rhodocyclaceae bacterium]|nr:hypothetical protein [Rhodocyclaceae bacterium]